MMRAESIVLRAAAALAAAILAGCSSAAPAHPLPSSGPALPAASSQAPPPHAPPARQAVVAAYLASWAASDQAERSGNAAAARQILAPYLTGPYLRVVVARMAPYWASHETARGPITAHLQRVYVRGRAAVVVDCQDASRHVLVSTLTGNPVPGTRGPARARLYTTLVLAQGRWRVASITYTGSSCRP